MAEELPVRLGGPGASPNRFVCLRTATYVQYTFLLQKFIKILDLQYLARCREPWDHSIAPLEYNTVQLFLSRLAVAACFAVFSATGTTITFDGLNGSNADPFNGIASAGYTVSVASGNWYQSQVFGNNIPSIFTRLLNGIEGSIMLAGGTFTMQSVDVAANNGNATYTFIGLLRGAAVFSNSGIVTGHSGPFFFETVSNPSAASVIDTLYILVGAATSPSSINLDNIVIHWAEPPPPPGASVPEPETVTLSGFSLAALVARRRCNRTLRNEKHARKCIRCR